MPGDFFDTNVFVYALDPAEPRKRAIASDLLARALEGNRTVISYQVVQETLRVLTAKSRFGASAVHAVDFLERMLLPLWSVMPTADLYRRGLAIQDRYGFSFYDSLIVAAALEGGCGRILSEDLQHGQRIESLTIENPFRE